MSETVSEREFQSHTPWCQSRKRLRFDPSVCNCDQSVTTRGSQAHEAEEALAEGSACCAGDAVHDRGRGDCHDSDLRLGGSDTARLQQIRERQHEVTSWHAHADRDWMLKHIDVQALALRTAEQEADRRGIALEKERSLLVDAEDALRTVREERDKWQALALGCSEAHTSLRADVERLTAEREHFKAANAAYDKQVTRLTGERDAFKQLTSEAEGKVVDLLTDVEEAETERDNARRQLGVVQNSCRISERLAAKAEQQVLALREGIARMHAWNSDDMQIRHRQVVLADDLTALLAAIKET